MDDKSAQPVPPAFDRPEGEPDVVLPGGGKPYGGFWWRVLAALIDAVILFIPVAIIVQTLSPDMVTFEFDPNATVDPNFTIEEIFKPLSPMASFVLMALYMLYFAGFESSPVMATPGKRVVGLRVTDLYGHQLTVGRALFRAWPWWISAAAGLLDALIGSAVLAYFAGLLFLIACIAVAFTERKQGIHDIFASCLITKRRAVFGN
ncbi:MAG: RDD family protein [Pseudomonadota bacterium]